VKVGKSDILIDNFQKMGYKLQKLLGELNRLRDPETDNREDPLNLLGNASAGKQIR
jgi:hypothetical protein